MHFIIHASIVMDQATGHEEDDDHHAVSCESFDWWRMMRRVQVQEAEVKYIDQDEQVEEDGRQRRLKRKATVLLHRHWIAIRRSKQPL